METPRCGVSRGEGPVATADGTLKMLFAGERERDRDATEWLTAA